MHDQKGRANPIPGGLAQTSFGTDSLPSAGALPATPDVKVPEVPAGVPGADAAKDLQKKGQDAVDKGKKEADDAKEKAKKAEDDAKKKAEDEKKEAQKKAAQTSVGQAANAATGAEVPGAMKVNPASIVIKGQWVKNEEGKDMILMDPTDQPYEVIYADRGTNSVTKFERDDD